MDVVKEALLHYRSMWSMWLELKHTTEAERELARTKIELIDRELSPREITLRRSSEPRPAFEPPADKLVHHPDCLLVDGHDGKCVGVPE